VCDVRIVLTGAGGFIGRHLAPIMTAAGDDVFALVPPGRALGEIPVRRVIEVDLSDAPTLRRELASVRPELCVHLAWRGWSGPHKRPVVNVESLAASATLLVALAEVGCGHVVATGSCFEYAESAADLTEGSPLGPRGLYATCKVAFCEIAGELAKERDMGFAWARLFQIYGPHDARGRLIPATIQALLRGDEIATTEGRQLRDVLYVGDAAEALWALARSGQRGPVNVASGRPVAVATVLDQIARQIGRPDLVRRGALPYRPGEPHRLVGDTRLLAERVGWRPRVSLEDGIARTIAWWREQPQ